MTTTICDQCGAEVGACGLEATIREGTTGGFAETRDGDFCSWECLARWSTGLASGTPEGAPARPSRTTAGV